MGLIRLVVGGAIDANRAIKQNKAKNDDSKNTVTAKGLYSIEVPSFLSPTNKLGGDASLQYWSKSLDITFQVVDEPKSEFVTIVKEMKDDIPPLGNGNPLLDKMAVVTLSNLFDLSKTDISNYTERTISGLKAITLNAFQKRTFLKDALYGSLAFIEGKNNLYQVIILSGGTSISKLADKLEASILSFKEL